MHILVSNLPYPYSPLFISISQFYHPSSIFQKPWKSMHSKYSEKSRKYSTLVSFHMAFGAWEIVLVCRILVCFSDKTKGCETASPKNILELYIEKLIMIPTDSSEFIRSLHNEWEGISALWIWVSECLLHMPTSACPDRTTMIDSISVEARSFIVKSYSDLTSMMLTFKQHGTDTIVSRRERATCKWRNKGITRPRVRNKESLK